LQLLKYNYICLNFIKKCISDHHSTIIIIPALRRGGNDVYGC